MELSMIFITVTYAGIDTTVTVMNGVLLRVARTSKFQKVS